MSESVSDLSGKTLIKCEQSTSDGEDYIIFETDSGDKYKMHHSQSCCEDVHIEDIAGDLRDLVGSPLIIAREDTNNSPEYALDPNSATQDEWTFYNFATQKGYVTIRWYGSSNGYYSTSVDFKKENKKE